MLNLPLLIQRIDEISLAQPAELYTVDIPAETGEPRKYLGLSGLGDECSRKVWYQFRHCVRPKFPPRLMRLFRRGHREEYVFVNLLRAAGMEVFTADENGKQFKVSELSGHLSGHVDAVAKAPTEYGYAKPFLVEMKTYNDKRFRELTTRGVKHSDPKYYIQMQGYMGLLKLKAALFMAVNKNDDTLHLEWIKLNGSEFERTMELAEELVNACKPPKRLSEMATDFRCRYCDCHPICHKREPSLKSCRSCAFAEPAEGASWTCKAGREFGDVCGEYQDCNQ